MTTANFSVRQDILSAYGAGYGSATPNAGSGWFPDHGSYVCFFMGVEQRPFKMKDKATGAETPCTSYVFTFKLTEDPTAPEAPRSFEDSFLLYDNPADVKEDWKRRNLDKDVARLKGHLNGIMGRETSLADLGKLGELAGTAVVALDSVWETYKDKQGNERVNKRAFVRGSVAQSEVPI